MKMKEGNCMVGQPSSVKDVFKYTQNGREVFYVVIKPIDNKLALCYSIYPY